MKKISVTFLVISFLSTLVSCNQESCFRSQKYTDLKLRKTKEELHSNFRINSQLIENQSITGLNEIDNVSEPLNLVDGVFGNSDSKQSDDPKLEENIFILKNSIQQKNPILVKCGDDKFLVVDPYIDTISNRLCGNYVLIRELVEPIILEIEINAINCSQISDNCVDIQSFESSILRTYKVTKTDVVPLNTIGNYITEGKRVYLLCGKSVYLVHEAKYDSINNNLCGRFVKIENERIAPNICLEINKEGTKQISTGCIDLETVMHVSKNNIETISKKERKGLNKFGLSLILIGVLGSILLLTINNMIFGGSGLILDALGFFLTFAFLLIVSLALVILLLITIITWAASSK